MASFWQIGVGGGHAALQLDCALHRIDRAAEFDKHTVAGDFEDAALVEDNQGLQHLVSPGLEHGQRARLVPLHEAAVTDDVRGENGGKAALDASFGHLRRLLQKTERTELYECLVEWSIEPDFRNGSWPWENALAEA